MSSHVTKKLRRDLLSGVYNLSPVSVFRAKDGRYYSRWCAKDAVISKALSMVLAPVIKRSVGDKCYHLHGCGGLKGALQKAGAEISNYNYVIKSDVNDFYARIDHHMLLNHCQELIKASRIIRILYQYMNRLEDFNDKYYLVSQVISRGWPLSQLMGALILKSLDRIVPQDCFYVRYMDDWLILTKTRWQLRRLIKEMYKVMEKLKFKLAIDKSYIGKIARGFNF